MSFQKICELGPRLFGEKEDDLGLALELDDQLLQISGLYRELLLAISGPVVFDNGAKFVPDEKSPLDGRDGHQNLEILFGLGKGKNSIRQKATQYYNELPAAFVPIGEASGGNLICVNGKGAVHLWDHESDRDSKTWFIANAIDDFLLRLKPDDHVLGSTDGIIEAESFLDF